MTRAERAARDARICAAYRRGETSGAIGWREGLSECSVRDILKKRRVPLRPAAWRRALDGEHFSTDVDALLDELGSGDG